MNWSKTYEDWLVRYTIWLAAQHIEKKGSYTWKELREELFDLDLIDYPSLDPRAVKVWPAWELRVDREGPFGRKAGTLNDMCFHRTGTPAQCPDPGTSPPKFDDSE